ncbi:MAG: hypothetical protein LBP61_01585 [Desulfovibrio sp.]|jgi:hypothetical protein|nr:hypothetical protein [Desulfovibrio sp.]
MLKEDISSAASALSGLAGKVDGDAWETIRNVRSNLFSLAEQAGALEEHAVIHLENPLPAFGEAV